MFALYGCDMQAEAARESQAPWGCEKTIRPVFSGQLANRHQVDRLTLRGLKQQKKSGEVEGQQREEGGDDEPTLSAI